MKRIQLLSMTRLTSVATSAGFDTRKVNAKSTLFHEDLGRMTFLGDKLGVDFRQSSYSLSDLAQ